MSGRQRNYVSLSSNDDIEGNVKFLAAYEAATLLERLDLLKDWIGLLRAQYQTEMHDWHNELRRHAALLNKKGNNP